MSFNVMLELRPFMDIGIPGIESHGAHECALIRGTVEVHGHAEAKWLRVELRKTETVWGDGYERTFSETIGGHPVVLWSSKGEEVVRLRPCGFPFCIKIPSTTPPSTIVGGSAAIKYELVASVLLQSKRSLFKQTSTSTISHTVPITIERYDLLQTWPVHSYIQSRRISARGVSLIAYLQCSAFGPGDIISVECIQYVDFLGVITAYIYELTVCETFIFRSTSPPITCSNIISKQLSPSNEYLSPGVGLQFTLRCQIPLVHTNVSVWTAHLIEVKYVVRVKVLLGSRPTTLALAEFPVTITNWQRQASQNTMSQIGRFHELSEHIGASPSFGIEQLDIPSPPATEKPVKFGNRIAFAALRSIARPVNMPDLISRWSVDSPSINAGATTRSTKTHPSVSSRFQGSSVAHSRATARSTPSSYIRRGYDH
ncbi:hypothetical protein BDV93DRAFT_609150 [Ceratobasidium sp. AG-I]|nr:hypothetical protein BDV93DRAFT_609150 [Ceratobasidium sp. AG-I]